MKLCSGCFTVAGSSPCPSCKSKRTAVHESNPERTAKKASNYNAAFRAKREEWKKILLEETVNCSRCKKPVNPLQFNLDHIEGGLWPAHPFCNQSAGGKEQGKKKLK